MRVTPPAIALHLPSQAGDTAASGMAAIEQHPDWRVLAQVPMRLTAGVGLAHFKVKDLLGLTAGSVVESDWPGGADIPLRCGNVQVGWAEFEVVEQRLAVRMTRLA